MVNSDIIITFRRDNIFIMKQENSPKTRNPKWHRDEIILALDLYFKLERKDIGANNPEIIELSKVLNKLPIHNKTIITEKFRNPNGVSLKLSNFLAIDPDYKGKGMGSYSKQDYLIFNEFVGHKDTLSDIALAIKCILKGELLPELNNIENDEIESVGMKEGQTLYKYHKYKERNRTLVAKKKRHFLNKHKHLFCEICGFDFANAYGDLGNGFIECHHILPLSEVTKEQNTKLEDLSLVCANCHRMLHRNMGVTIENLKEIIKANGTD